MNTPERVTRELKHPAQHRSVADEFDSGDVLLEMNKAADRICEMSGYVDCQNDLMGAYLSHGTAGLKAVMYHGPRWAKFVHQYEAA